MVLLYTARVFLLFVHMHTHRSIFVRHHRLFSRSLFRTNVFFFFHIHPSIWFILYMGFSRNFAVLFVMCAYVSLTYSRLAVPAHSTTIVAAATQRQRVKERAGEEKNKTEQNRTDHTEWHGVCLCARLYICTYNTHSHHKVRTSI